MSVVWHEVECGGYAADLPLWEEIVAETGGKVLDLGCGTGRVALHLAKRGHSVTGLDLDAELVAAFNERAPEAAHAVAGDARDFALEDEFGAVLAPMQLLQLLDNADERLACMRCVVAHMADRAVAALAIVESLPEPSADAPPVPDAREVDGWVYSSLPLSADRDQGAVAVRRLRQTVSPAGELSEHVDVVRLLLFTAEQLEAEARTIGLRPLDRRMIAATQDHVGSTVVLLGKEN